MDGGWRITGAYAERGRLGASPRNLIVQRSMCRIELGDRHPAEYPKARKLREISSTRPRDPRQAAKPVELAAASAPGPAPTADGQCLRPPPTAPPDPEGKPPTSASPIRLPKTDGSCYPLANCLSPIHLRSHTRGVPRLAHRRRAGSTSYHQWWLPVNSQKNNLGYYDRGLTETQPRFIAFLTR
jgi:hypothetical protein